MHSGESEEGDKSNHREESQRKKSKKKKKNVVEYHLAWWNLWWLRMVREGDKAEKDRMIEVEKQASSKCMNKFLLRQSTQTTQRNEYLEMVGRPQDGAVPKLEARPSTSTCDSNYNLEMSGPPEKDACPYYYDVRGKKRFRYTNGATDFTLVYFNKLACRQDLDTHSAEPTTGSEMNYLESAD